MGLHPRKKSHISFGPPETLALVAVIVVGATAALWLHALYEPSWQSTPATQYACELSRLAYSRDNIPDQVHLRYEYTVEKKAYEGCWDGFWPQAQSPNALARENLSQLQEGRFPLKVFYDPQNPAVNRIHYAQSLRPTTYLRLFIIALVLTASYLLKIYPAWKLRG